MLKAEEIAENLKVSVNGYNTLEDYVVEHPNDKKALCFACKLYEQFEEYLNDDQSRLSHIQFWMNNAEDYFSKQTKQRFGVGGTFPVAVNFECTTICNARCKNCTHEKLISSGIREAKYVSLDKMKYYIKKVKLITLVCGIEDPLVLPVGLGEPLCHPQIMDILKYMEIFFKRISFTTNANLLNTHMAKQLAKIKLESITLSLSYFNEQNYLLQCGLDFNRTVKNIIYYLKMRREEKSSGLAVIHIFDNNLNTEQDRQKFKETFEKYIRPNDVLNIRQYYELADNDNLKSKLKNRNTFRPCYQLWQQLTVDVDGNLFPCCIAVWQKRSAYLELGNLEKTSLSDIFGKLSKIRAMQFDNEFGVCENCEILHHNEEFWLPSLLYDKKKCISGNIEYKMGTIGKVIFSRLESLMKRLNKRVMN